MSPDRHAVPPFRQMPEFVLFMYIHALMGFLSWLASEGSLSHLETDVQHAPGPLLFS